MCKIEFKLMASSQHEPTLMSYISHLETMLRLLYNVSLENFWGFFFLIEKYEYIRLRKVRYAQMFEKNYCGLYWCLPFRILLIATVFPVEGKLRNLLAQCFKCQSQSKVITCFSEFLIHFPIFQQCILYRIHLLVKVVSLVGTKTVFCLRFKAYCFFIICYFFCICRGCSRRRPRCCGSSDWLQAS